VYHYPAGAARTTGPPFFRHPSVVFPARCGNLTDACLEETSEKSDPFARGETLIR